MILNTISDQAEPCIIISTSNYKTDYDLYLRIRAMSCSEDPSGPNNRSSTVETAVVEYLNLPGPGTPACQVTVYDIWPNAVRRHSPDPTFYKTISRNVYYSYSYNLRRPRFKAKFIPQTVVRTRFMVKPERGSSTDVSMRF